MTKKMEVRYSITIQAFKGENLIDGLLFIEDSQGDVAIGSDIIECLKNLEMEKGNRWASLGDKIT